MWWMRYLNGCAYGIWVFLCISGMSYDRRFGVWIFASIAFCFSSLEPLSSDEWNACIIWHDSLPGMIRLTTEYNTVDIGDENASPLPCWLPISRLSYHSSWISPRRCRKFSRPFPFVGNRFPPLIIENRSLWDSRPFRLRV